MLGMSRACTTRGQKALGFFFDELLAVGGFVCGDDFFRELAGHVIVVRELHGIGGAALRFGSEVIGVRQHFRERHLRLDDDVVAAAFAAGDAAATPAEVTHQVAGVLVGGVDFDVHDGFEENGTSLLHGFPESERAGDFERHIGRVDVVILAVVEHGTEIDNRKTSEIAASGGIANALLHGRNPVPRNCTPENIIDELDALATLDGLHLDAANAKLAVAAGLFLVLAFRVGLAANGFAIGNFGGLEGEVDMVALVELGDDDFDMLLAGAGQQKFLGLRIARKAQRGIFLEDFMDRDADLVFVGAGFRLDGKGDGRLGKLRGRVKNGRSFVAKGFAGSRFLQFGDGADVSGVQLTDFDELLALHDLDMLKALQNVAIVIGESGVIFQDSALHLEVVDAAGERIGKRFEDEEGERLAVVVLAIEAIALAAGVFEAYLGVLIRVGESVSKKSEQAGGADVAKRGSHQDGKDFFRDDGFADGGDEVVDGNGAFAEKLLHHFVVAFSDHFDEFFVSFLGVAGQGGGDLFDGGFAVAIGMVEVCFHGHQIDDAPETSFGADWQLERDDVAAENLFERFHGALKAGEFAVHPGENEGAGNVVLGAVVPNFFGGDLRADVGVNGDERGISGDERGFGFGDESGIAGEVDEINFDFLGRAGGSSGGGGPFGVGETRLNGDFSGDFFFVPVGSGAAFRNFSPTRSHDRGEEQRRHQLRLAGAAVADNANVANVPGEIGLHANLQKARSVRKKWGAGRRLASWN